MNFLAFVVAFFRPARFARIVLGGAQAPGYNVLLAHIQMGRCAYLLLRFREAFGTRGVHAPVWVVIASS